MRLFIIIIVVIIIYEHNRKVNFRFYKSIHSRSICLPKIKMQNRWNNNYRYARNQNINLNQISIEFRLNVTKKRRNNSIAEVWGIEIIKISSNVLSIIEYRFYQIHKLIDLIFLFEWKVNISKLPLFSLFIVEEKKKSNYMKWIKNEEKSKNPEINNSEKYTE